MKKIIGIMITIGFLTTLKAQSPYDKQTINKLCGCFNVEFKYAETFSPDPSYKYHEREEINGGAELALPLEVSDKKIVIQHLLVITDSIIIKHWREEWTYENPEIWTYKGDRTWVKEKINPKDIKGKWTQTIWEVSDEPRYQGFSQFVNLDDKLIWQNTTDAPLPRREYSVRSDYNILKRTNRLNISDTGYVHEQDNEKIVRKNGTDKLLVQEKGLNTYKRLTDKECNGARYYWERYQGYWSKVRKVWADYISSHNSISLKMKVDSRMLHDYLLDLSNDYVNKKVNDADIDARIKGEINKFIRHDDMKSVAHQ